MWQFGRMSKIDPGFASQKEIPEATVVEKCQFLSEVGSYTAATVKMIQVKSPLRMDLFNKLCLFGSTSWSNKINPQIQRFCCFWPKARFSSPNFCDKVLWQFNDLRSFLGKYHKDESSGYDPKKERLDHFLSELSKACTRLTSQFSKWSSWFYHWVMVRQQSKGVFLTTRQRPKWAWKRTWHHLWFYHEACRKR